jgi:hypothetical protein
MSVKTLNRVEATTIPATVISTSVSTARTYSVAPETRFIPEQKLNHAPAELSIFLENENPIGCIRGVMWVMAFNAGVFLIGMAIWQSCKHLL